jgi:2',3'-cyclic-nucleotide 2'-phosphodiesterase/3'-nucleotidase
LTSYFALIGHSPVQDLLARAQADNMARALAGMPEAALPMLVAAAPFKAGGRGGPGNYTAIPAGPLTARHIADLYIHPNSPVALRVSGAEIALWLERSASLYNQIAPGAQDAPLIDRDFPAYNFDMIHGLGYQVDLSQPARHDFSGRVTDPEARRIVNLTHQGRPLRPEESFVLVTNSYRASGGAGFAGTDPAHVVMEESRPLRRVLQDYIARQGRVTPVAEAGWRFAPMPGSSVTFDSAPEAARHATDLPGLEPIGLQPTGFLRFRLRL